MMLFAFMYSEGIDGRPQASINLANLNVWGTQSRAHWFSIPTELYMKAIPYAETSAE
jgi:hypothetical protein